MRRIIIYTIACLIISSASFGQKGNKRQEKIEKLLVTTPSHSTGQIYKPLKVDPKKKYDFKDEGKKVEYWDNEHRIINSDMLVDNDPLTDIKFTTANLRGDTLSIEIYQTDESHDHHYTIEVINNKYHIEYNFSLPVDSIDRKIEPLDFQLTLNKKKFKKGQEIRGYTEFKGKCIVLCYQDIFTAKGNFKVLVK